MASDLIKPRKGLQCQSTMQIVTSRLLLRKLSNQCHHNPFTNTDLSCSCSQLNSWGSVLKVFPDTIWHCCCLQLYPNLSTGDDQMCPATLHWLLVSHPGSGGILLLVSHPGSGGILLLLSHPGSAAPHPSQSGNQGTSYQEQPLFKQQQLGRNIPCFDKSRLRTC